MWPIRLANCAVVGLMAYYLVWVIGHLVPGRLWIGLPFAAASLMCAACLVLSAINSSSSKVTPPRPLAGDEARAGRVGAWGVLPRATRSLGSRARRDGQAGNLNSALEFLRGRFPHVRYIETRDADDEVGVTRFLSHTVGQLEAEGRFAFVRTVKQAQVSPGDPFVNLNGDFYRGQMLARNAANAVFPCGSGFWRRSALDDIGGFPRWNLVEDFQSGIEALRRGWHGCYLPIVGAVGQHSPEDVPNVIKQRGTWAIDSVRLLIWGQRQGLTLRQRLAFAETLLFYLHSFTLLVYVPCAAITCLGVLPLEGTLGG